MNGLIKTKNGIVKAPGLKARGATQNARVREGIQSGELGTTERAALRAARAGDRAHLASAKEDGVVTGRERAALHRDMNQTSRLLVAFKHN